MSQHQHQQHQEQHQEQQDEQQEQTPTTNLPLNIEGNYIMPDRRSNA
jgi:hypothetical protein